MPHSFNDLLAMIADEEEFAKEEDQSPFNEEQDVAKMNRQPQPQSQQGPPTQGGGRLSVQKQVTWSTLGSPQELTTKNKEVDSIISACPRNKMPLCTAKV